MDIRELAIDDWVRHEFYEMNMRVRRIDGDTGRILAERDGLSTQAHIDHYRPIDITPDLLKKNGFVKMDEITAHWRCQIDKRHRIESSGFSVDCMTLYYDRLTSCEEWVTTAQMDCGCVHELQHFFRMTGIDKDIKL
jgi:hypothetical protein